MQKLLLAGLLLAGFSANAQAWVNPLPLDSATHKVTYEAVVQAPGISKSELYTRARTWFANSFGSAKAVLEMDDVTSGKLIGNATGNFTTHFMGSNVASTLWRTITVQVKDGRYKYTVTDFAVDVNRGRANATPVEQFLTPSKTTYDKDGKPKAYLASIIQGVQENGERQAASLVAAMSAATKKEKDW